MKAREHDEEAHRIANTARQYVSTHLREDDATWYQWAVLRIYAARQTFSIDRQGTLEEGFAPFCCSSLTIGYLRDNHCIDLCNTNGSSSNAGAMP